VNFAVEENTHKNEEKPLLYFNAQMNKLYSRNLLDMAGEK
jgi:hypothetical protein